MAASDSAHQQKRLGGGGPRKKSGSTSSNSTGSGGVRLSNEEKMQRMLARMEGRQTALSKQYHGDGGTGVGRDDLIRNLDAEFYEPLKLARDRFLLETRESDASGQGPGGLNSARAMTEVKDQLGRLQHVLSVYARSIPSYELKRAQLALKNVENEIKGGEYAQPDTSANGVQPNSKIPDSKSNGGLPPQAKMGGTRGTVVPGGENKKPTTDSVGGGGSAGRSFKSFSFAKAQPSDTIKTRIPSPTKAPKTALGDTTVLAGERGAPDDGLSAMSGVAVIKGKSGEKIELSKDDLDGKDIVIMDLRGCEVFVPFRAASFQIRNLTDCRLLALPVASSILLENCTGCSFDIGCQQLRAHTSRDCDFYLSVTSNPIIEDCDRVRFAPYVPLQVEEEVDHVGDIKGKGTSCGEIKERGPLENQQEESNAVTAVENKWDQVKDFNWMLNTQSPHWSILPEAERKDWKF